MAVSPTYARVGVLAPVILVIARLVQGLSIGGEFAASTTFLVESAPPRRRGLFSSLQLNHGFTAGNALIVSTIALVFLGVLQPLAGMLSDRIGRKPMLLAFSAGLAVLTVPMLHLVSGFVGLLVVALVAMTLLSG